MIKFFRQIRQNLLMENPPAKSAGKTSRYLKYALGEIILVVIGILIALQVNNLNDQRKTNNQKKLLVASVITDLKMDTTMLGLSLKMLEEDTAQNLGFTQRMSNSHTTLDTLIQIARFEFDPRLQVSFTFNDHTFQSLMSTGNLNIMDRWVQEDLLTLNEIHKTYISRTNLNASAYVDQVIAYARKYPLSDYGNISPHSPLAEAIWKRAEYEELGVSFNALLGIRNVTNLYAIDQIKTIRQKTKEILQRFSEETKP